MVTGSPRWVRVWSECVYGGLTPGEYMPDNKVQALAIDTRQTG